MAVIIGFCYCIRCFAETVGLGIFAAISEVCRNTGKHHESFLMPSLIIFDSRVVRLRPKSFVAPFSPLMRQLVASKALMMLPNLIDKGH